jgi:putative transposase
VVVGFLDESAIQSTPNRRRVINTPLVSYSDKGSDGKRKKTIFGLMLLNGNDVVMVSNSSKAPDMVSFLELARKENPRQHIIVVLDNARIHIAAVVKVKAGELGITLVFLPPYSPDLNPTEFGWKDLKRQLSALLDFDSMVGCSKECALKLFQERKYSYSKHWRKVLEDECLPLIHVRC